MQIDAFGGSAAFEDNLKDLVIDISKVINIAIRIPKAGTSTIEYSIIKGILTDLINGTYQSKNMAIFGSEYSALMLYFNSPLTKEKILTLVQRAREIELKMPHGSKVRSISKWFIDEDTIKRTKYSRFLKYLSASIDNTEPLWVSKAREHINSVFPIDVLRKIKVNLEAVKKRLNVTMTPTDDIKFVQNIAGIVQWYVANKTSIEKENEDCPSVANKILNGSNFMVLEWVFKFINSPDRSDNYFGPYVLVYKDRNWNAFLNYIRTSSINIKIPKSIQ